MVAPRPTPTDGVAAVEAHLAALPQPHQETLRALRGTRRGLLPQGEECLKYGMPCFTVQGKGVAAYDGFKRHCSCSPKSGGVIAETADRKRAPGTARG